MESAVFLGYQSALEYLCRERYFDATSTGTWNSDKELPPIPPADRTATVRSLPDKLPSDDQISALLDGPLRGLSTPIHVLVPSQNTCSRSRLKISHLWSQHLLTGSFQIISKDVYCSSPEFCFVQMARMLSLVELARLANELCGTYALAPYEEDGFRTCRPLISHLHLKSFINRAVYSHIRWSQNAKQVLRFVGDRSASPMETTVALLLALPYRYGGYAAIFPAFNDVFLSGRAADTELPYHCDLLWKKHRVAVEYEGEDYHTGIDRIERDADRCNALVRGGIHIIRITKRQLYNTQRFDKLARQILAFLGKRPCMDRCRYNWNERRDLLRAQLLPSKNNSLCNERIGRTSISF